MSLTTKIKYFTTCAALSARAERRRCPSCNSDDSNRVASKAIVTSLHRCNACELLFRVPTTTSEENARFYQSEYTQGFTTDLPTDAELESLLAAKFQGSEKHYAEPLALLDAIGVPRGARIFDFGCSWGYGSWQLMQAGFNVQAFEISQSRCNFASTRLQVDASPRLDRITGPFDVFFSSHVLEHVPAVSESLALARRLVRPGGWFIAYTPNGSEPFRIADAKAWMKMWGSVHPNYLDSEYYSKAFGATPHLLASTPYDYRGIATWASSLNSGATSLDLTGPELLVVARL